MENENVLHKEEGNPDVAHKGGCFLVTLGRRLS